MASAQGRLGGERWKSHSSGLYEAFEGGKGEFSATLFSPSLAIGLHGAPRDVASVLVPVQHALASGLVPDRCCC